MVGDTPSSLTPRRQMLAASVIGALALAGSIGAMRTGRATCPPGGGLPAAGGGILPLPELEPQQQPQPQPEPERERAREPEPAENPDPAALRGPRPSIGTPTRGAEEGLSRQTAISDDGQIAAGRPRPRSPLR
ncbi:hypothetical protein [Tautonia sociabilis]|uniref:Uncharacterized protein n=1 Tax=Tautonia sociabilis TaxID=2080755 RepID=A0A432MP89_9BACT|nr:hypothetical protein [Tautonia sociabilis]RUL89222.1 hypothetical protein TsocGM_03655 [Tautonia sociabilis]